MLENSFYRVEIASGGLATDVGFIDGRNMQNYAESSYLDPDASGTGYLVGDVLSDGEGHSVTVDRVDGDGKILSYVASPIGFNAQVNDSPTMTGGNGSGADFKFGGYPADLADSTSRARGNVRFRQMMDQIQLMANGYPCNADYSVADTTSFTLYFERDEFVMTPDETTPGVMLYGADAVKRCIARSMLMGKTTLRDVYDPSATAGSDNASEVSMARNPSVVSDVYAAPLVASSGSTPEDLATDLSTATGAVTVTKIPLTDIAI